jgi:hypothetical protein
MDATHLEFLVEEPSMEAFLRSFLPRVLPAPQSFEVHAFQGKSDLLNKLEARLKGYASWLPTHWRIVVVIDRDNDDCLVLKQQLESAAHQAGLRSRTATGHPSWQLVNRIAIEELEAWFFGDWQAVQQAYPRIPSTIPNRAAFRNPDAIRGGTWEAFERVMRQHGYFPGGLEKITAARAIGGLMDPLRSRSASFRTFHQALLEAVN